MRILLDESLPRRLRRVFAGHEVVTVAVLVARNNKLESLRVPAAELLVRLDSISPRSLVGAVANLTVNRTRRFML
jgi:hypothetical protein